jgi:hypothetical protein
MLITRKLLITAFILTFRSSFCGLIFEYKQKREQNTPSKMDDKRTKSGRLMGPSDYFNFESIYEPIQVCRIKLQHLTIFESGCANSPIYKKELL